LLSPSCGRTATVQPGRANTLCQLY
jgi:hypothetical protein